MLGKFGAVGLAHDVKAVGVPNVVLKTDDLPPECLGLLESARLQDLAADVVCAKQSRFFCHHVVFGGGVAFAV